VGVTVKPDLKKLIAIAALVVFVALPILFYALGDFPRRSVLKEAISLLTLVALSLMLGQFFLARSNMGVIELYNLRRIRTVHAVIAYFAVSWLLLHPFLVVVPRFFEAGIEPWDAMTMMLTTYSSTGIALGLAAWVLLLVLTVTAIFRIRLIKALHTKYPRWRHFHGMLSIALTTFALLHAISLGRHTDTPMATMLIVVSVVGVAMLLRMYFPQRAGAPEPPSAPNVREQAR